MMSHALPRPRPRAALALGWLLIACTPAPASSPPPAANPPPGKQPEEAGFADPKVGAETPPESPAAVADPALAAQIKERFGERCRYERACGELLGIDCDAAVDGPYYYVERTDLKIVSTCGGACRRGCTDCPPKAWTCPTY